MPVLVKVDPKDPKASMVVTGRPTRRLADREDKTEWPTSDLEDHEPFDHEQNSSGTE